MSRSPKIRTLRPRITERTGRLLVRTFDDTERIRGTTLQNIRKAHFAEFPLCRMCLQETPPRTSLATELDHIVPLHMGGKETSDPFHNRQGLCDEHHEQKSKEERGHTFNLKKYSRGA